MTATPGQPGEVNGTLKRAIRADRYRIFAKILTVDTDPQQVALIHDLSFHLEGLPSGKTVEIYAISANYTGDAAPGPTVSAVVG